jgi:peptide/nickel transport system substrate-binding protein
MSVILAIGLLLFLGPVQYGLSAEKPLIIAFRGDAATMDPHARAETTTLAIQGNIYERLIDLDLDLNLAPKLAETWKLIDDHTWEFKLKRGVKFQNGEPFNAAAVKFSLVRAKTWKKSQFKRYLPDYKEILIVDDDTLRIITKNPEPELPLMISNINMAPPKFFQSHDPGYLATHACGTGAYKLVEWVKDDHFKLTANEDWHGGTVDFKEVIIRPIPNDATRVAALISGEIDACWAVSIPDISRIESDPNTYIKRCPSQRIIYLMLDVYTKKGGPGPEMQPGIPAGAPNPYRDIRVRKAVAHAINVDEIIQYVMNGSAYPATQVLTNFAPDFNPNIKRTAYDPELAKKLLAEAGFADGFVTNFDTPNDRYINDSQVAEAIAGQLKKVGINLKVVAQPKSVYFAKIKKI